MASWTTGSPTWSAVKKRSIEPGIHHYNYHYNQVLLTGINHYHHYNVVIFLGPLNQVLTGLNHYNYHEFVVIFFRSIKPGIINHYSNQEVLAQTDIDQ